ncbi:NADH-cytochrome b5 reductase-like [Amphibalanus amphitrite]|uniref:NADH-cytochrome b5 reductase-like n=1 Tax=Amphibalanus amphitrite TaxID=1232801 RepID=UPI001C90C7BA|nr:NADH-cytochrome b5 reductase-like [Amphibalanus amphitrite]
MTARRAPPPPTPALLVVAGLTALTVTSSGCSGVAEAPVGVSGEAFADDRSSFSSGSAGGWCRRGPAALCAAQPWGESAAAAGARNGSGPGGGTHTALLPHCFTALPLVAVTAVSDSAAVYRFKLPAGAALRHPLGSHLLLRAADADGRAVTRAYGPVSDPQAVGYFEVYIRLYPSGAMSRCVRRWRVGQTALWSGPFGEYRPRPTDRRLVLLAAGTGVAPLVGLMAEAVARPAAPRLSLLLSVRRLQEVFPRRRLARWARSGRITYELFVTGPEADGERPWPGETVTRRRIQRRDVLAAAQQPGTGTRYLVCGPQGLVEAVRTFLRQAGVSDRDIVIF